ncbi:MAG: formate dehydrogenase subunit delta [Porticoccaceae bacterium]|nr:formate dehydrogenase subunit delta [Porticoccaceae bacterium]
MSANSSEHLVKMANQIVQNIPAATAEARITSAANHMDKFWSPLMKKQIGEYLAAGGEDLLPEASQALKKIIA